MSDEFRRPTLEEINEFASKYVVSPSGVAGEMCALHLTPEDAAKLEEAIAIAEASAAMAKPADDPVTGPAHYGGDACRRAQAAMVGKDPCIVPEGSVHPLTPQALHWWQSALEYLWRWPRKGGVQDLEKCKQDIDFIIEEVKG